MNLNLSTMLLWFIQVSVDLDDEVHQLVLDQLLGVEVGDQKADVVALYRKRLVNANLVRQLTACIDGDPSRTSD